MLNEEGGTLLELGLQLIGCLAQGSCDAALMLL